MKIDSTLIKAVVSQSDTPKERVKAQKGQRAESQSSILKNDIRSVQSSTVRKVEFQDFGAAMEGVRNISRVLEEAPDAVREIHRELSQENTQYLLRSDE